MKWYEIKASAEQAEIWLYDQIGEDFWGEGTTAKSFVEELKGVTSPVINLHINSGGGSVFDGQAIYNAIARHPAKVITWIDGVAASIASVIALAGDEVNMAANALFMIHDPWGMAMGNSGDIRAYADVLDKVADTLVGVYVNKADAEEDDIRQMMAAETWMSASEAYDLGFVDTVTEEMKAAASVDLSRFNYKHPPVAQAPESVEGDGQPVSEPLPSAEAVEEHGMTENDYLGMGLGLSPKE